MVSNVNEDNDTSTDKGLYRQFNPLTEALEEGQLKLLGHALRRERQHPRTKLLSQLDSHFPKKPITVDKKPSTRSLKLGILFLEKFDSV